ncbi:MAG: DUF2088 domain-containing protein, partial [Chloroflexi bacterium]|nr:DUF2088 domain-containing protein [Chloroflexota bacterium]
MPDTLRVEIPYGDETVDFSVEARRLLGVFTPHEVPTLAEEALGAELQRVLDAPIGAKPLREAAKGARRVVIVADDATRPTPTHRIIPLLLDALNASGVPDEAITVLTALGTHRAMTEDEIARKFGPAVTQRVAVVN